MYDEDDDDMANRIAALPERIELVGGPYCGYILFPQHEVITDVRAIETQSRPQPHGPTNFDPLSSSEIIFAGEAGLFRYVMESETKWSFKGEVEVQFAG